MVMLLPDRLLIFIAPELQSTVVAKSLTRKLHLWNPTSASGCQGFNAHGRLQYSRDMHCRFE